MSNGRFDDHLPKAYYYRVTQADIIRSHPLTSPIYHGAVIDNAKILITNNYKKSDGLKALNGDLTRGPNIRLNGTRYANGITEAELANEFKGCDTRDFLKHYSQGPGSGVGIRCTMWITQQWKGQFTSKQERASLLTADEGIDFEPVDPVDPVAPVEPVDPNAPQPQPRSYINFYQKEQNNQRSGPIFCDVVEEISLYTLTHNREHSNIRFYIKTTTQLTDKGYELVSWETNQSIIASVLKNEAEKVKEVLYPQEPAPTKLQVLSQIWRGVDKPKLALNILIGLGVVTAVVGAVFFPATALVALPVVGAKLAGVTFGGIVAATSGVLMHGARKVYHGIKSAYASYKARKLAAREVAAAAVPNLGQVRSLPSPQAAPRAVVEANKGENVPPMDVAALQPLRRSSSSSALIHAATSAPIEIKQNNSTGNRQDKIDLGRVKPVSPMGLPYASSFVLKSPAFHSIPLRDASSGSDGNANEDKGLNRRSINSMSGG